MPPRALPRLIVASALVACLATAAPGRAAAQEPQAPQTGEPAAAPAATAIAGWRITGGTLDPQDKLDELAQAIVPPGSYFVESGEADRVGTTKIGTIPRLERAFAAIGYAAQANAVFTAPGKVELRVQLQPFDRVRYIFVEGNWPLRQDEIWRRITLRPGAPLPMAGPGRDALIEAERIRVREYLVSEGYRDAQVRIDLDSRRGKPTPVNLYIRLQLGPGYPIGTLEVRGNESLATKEIDDQVRRYDWRFLWLRPLPFKTSILREDLAEVLGMYRQLGFPSARILESFQVDRDAKTVNLRLDVNERRKVEVRFEGNRCCRDDALRGSLTLFSRGSYDPYEVDASAEALVNAYRERGYMFARVTSRIERLGPQLDRVTFSIVEGPQLRVRRVEFLGNESFSDGQLANVVAVKPFPLLGYIGLGTGGYASARQLELDAENLGEYYRGQGFPDAQAQVELGPAPTNLQPLADAVARAKQDPTWLSGGDLYVRFLVQEGPRLVVDRIAFAASEGESLPYDDEYLRASLITLPNAPFRQATIREDEPRLRRVLGDAGYPYAQAEPEVVAEGTRVHLTWKVKLGPKVRVGPIFVRGNFFTREATILRWIPLRPGSPLTTTAIERGERNLALLQLFNNASPITFPGQSAGLGDRSDVVPMVVNVEERHDHWGVLRVGAGAATEQRTPGSDFPIGGYASLGYEHRNLLGFGYTLTGQGTYGNAVRRLTATFLNPRVFDTLLRFDVTGTYLEQKTFRLGDITSGAVGVGLARELAPGFDAFVRWNYRSVVRTEFLVRPPGPDENQTTVRLGTDVGSLSFGFDWLRLDNLLVPTRGYRLGASVELADPAFSFAIGEDRFIKVQSRSVVVIPLLSWLSLRHTFRYNQGFPLGGASVLPKVERFFAGGDTTLRGFDIDRARTEIIRTPSSPYISYVEFRPLGGSLRLLSNLDLQFPIARPIYGAVFLDTGVVADSFDELDLTAFRHGVGVTPLLVKLPVGDLSVSWAWPLDPQPGDAKSGRLHFNVGLLF